MSVLSNLALSLTFPLFLVLSGFSYSASSSSIVPPPTCPQEIHDVDGLKKRARRDC